MSELRTNRIVPRDGLVSGTGIGGGIIQIVQGQTDTAVETTNTASYEDSGLTATITPTRSDSKIFIMVSQPSRLANDGAGQNGGAYQIVRGSINIDNVQAYLFYNAGAGMTTKYNYIIYNRQILDSPATTSAVTYKTQHIAYGSGSKVYSQYSGRSYMTLIEVSG